LKDRVAPVIKIVAEFDGTLKSANKIFDQIGIIRREVEQEIIALTKDVNAIEGLTEYILAKRNELAHNKIVLKQRGELVMTSKRERVDAVLNAALAVVGDGIPIFGIKDVRHQLEKMRIDLDVSYPPAVIATILAADKRFKKTNTGLYEYIGKSNKGGKKTK